MVLPLPRTEHTRWKHKRGDHHHHHQSIKPVNFVGKIRNPASNRSLPLELLTDVLARVASSSFSDLFNAKLCCREFRGAAEDEYVLEHISIDKFPVIPWLTTEEEIDFLNRCIDSGNPEALYRQGMIEYFSETRMELGLEYLKRAAEKGHIEASYAYGLILVSVGGESAQHGLKLLNSLIKMSSKSRGLRIRQCRARTKAIIKEMWISNDHIGGQITTSTSCCHQKERASRIRDGESKDWEEENFCCDSCWEREVDTFCRMLQG